MVPLNDELLQAARRTADGLAEADRQALVARAEHHTAVRRLHLAGGSLREIAEALSLSHQRIQQIVVGSGGSWWRRAWRTRGTIRDAVCTWCSRPPSEVRKLVAGPNIYICDDCVVEAEKALPKLRSVKAKRLARVRCNFCRRLNDGNRLVVPGETANVCDDCLRICREFMALDAT